MLALALALGQQQFQVCDRLLHCSLLHHPEADNADTLDSQSMPLQSSI